MCLQCVTEAETFAKSIKEYELFPGWILTRATKDATFAEWKKGEYGLVRCNDPDLILACELLPVPATWEDEESDSPEYNKYFDNILLIAHALDKMTFSATAALMKALQVNLEENTNTFDVAEKLMRKLYEHVQVHKPRSIDEWERLGRGMTEEQWKEFKQSSVAIG